MQIKSLLKKLSENGHDKHRNTIKQDNLLSGTSSAVQVSSKIDTISFCDRNLLKISHQIEKTLKNINESQFKIKKITQNNESVIKNTIHYVPKNKSRFKEHMQGRMLQISKQDGDSLLAHDKPKHNCNKSSFYSTKPEFKDKSIPQYIKNIMKPCKIQSISLGVRPKTNRINFRTHLKNPHSRNDRISTLSIAKLRRQANHQLSSRELHSTRNVQQQDRLIGWSELRKEEQYDVIWMK